MSTLQYAEADGTLKLLDVDALVAEGNTGISEVSENPIELGADVVDHIRDKSDELTVEFVITNTPTRTVSSHAEGSLGAFRESGGAVVLQFDAAFDRVAAVLADLTRVRKAGLLWRISTALRLYESFQLQQVQVSRDPKSGNSAKFSLNLHRAIFVSTRYSPAPPLLPRTRPRVANGTQPTQRPRDGLLAGLLNRGTRVPTGGH